MANAGPPGVYGPLPYRQHELPETTKSPRGPDFPPRTFPEVTPYSRVNPPNYEGQQEGYLSETEYEPQLPDVDPDPYVNCRLVPGLDKCTFWPYINNLDVTLVMYYDPCEVSSGLAKLQIRSAASRTQRPNHKYVAVDCTTEKELCCMQNISKLPSYQLFSRGALVNSFVGIENLRARDIQGFVENTPVVDNSTPMSCQQPFNPKNA